MSNEVTSSPSASISSEIRSQGSGENDDLPSYLKILSAWRVVLCTQHGSCYTACNISLHLTRKHRLKGYLKKRILQQLNQFDLVADVSALQQPADGTPEIAGLPAFRGYLCHMPTCEYRSRNVNAMQHHYNQQHDWRQKDQGFMSWHTATVQTLFAETKHIRYFAVVPLNQLVDGVEESQQVNVWGSKGV